MGKFFNEGFEELGAERIFKYGEGNAEGNKTEDDFNDWRKNFWVEILDHYSQRQTAEQKRATLLREVSKKDSESILTEASHQLPEHPLMVKFIEGEEFKQDPTI